MNEILNTAHRAVRRGCEIAIEVRRSGDIGLRKKSALDLLTRADIAINQAIIDIIKEDFPQHAVLAEESTVSGKIDWNAPLWIVDPIDGTTNFAHGQVHVGVSVAFADKGQAQVGVVGALFLGETYSAVRGAGATCNDARIKSSSCSNLKDALIATGFPYKRDDIKQLARRVAAVLEHCRDLRRLGACSLDICWVANNRLDGYYETVSVWDMAAAALIAREAGAAVGHINSKPVTENTPDEFYCRELVVCSPQILQKFIEILRP